ncbi:MAG TPA: DUF493 family protein [Dokdonella sp.]|uniref:DUF493 family protein n=1 Tax=Dokdonella sp. TaxID=2291710 RepID=UPI0025BC0DDD|nr:DUF493 family protein [Dokdonella sp.]MBX3690676.1 DUF493 family protein [Dokdonella sp.]MCW5567752.1 DUF493 family protein [Dokdonella sp.]HNR92060.1 DUF493 family protein [Dokdonella sp.]
MRDLGDLAARNPDQGFQFPGEFEVTVLGRADAGLEAKLRGVLGSLGLPVTEGSVRTKPSSAGNYVSVSASFACPDRAHYDAVHAALRADPAVRWTL